MKLRSHWPFGLVLLAGTVLRLLVWLAYQPALFYSDSRDYLGNTFKLPSAGWHPPGYTLFLDVFLIDRHLAIVTAVQHVLVLLDAVVLYLLLRRLACGRWVATLAVTPLLLDAYQLQIEQYVLSETLFETLLVAAVVAALWPRARAAASLAAGPTAGRVAVVGLMLGLATFTRIDGIGLLLPLLGWLIWASVASRQGWRAPLLRLVAAVAGFALPLVALVGINAAGSGGGAQLTNTGPDWLYGRVAGFVNCPADAIPAAWRPLCPTQPLGHRPDPNWFESDRQSPERRWQHQHHDLTAVQQFAVHVIERQPLDYAGAVLSDWAKQFRPTRDRAPGTPPVAAWLFRTTLQPVDPTKPQPAQMVAAYGHGRARLDLGLARFLVGYQRWAYLPGPLVALALLAGLVTLVLRRRDPRAPGLFLLLGIGVMAMLVATAFVVFSWRYVLPTLFVYPPAAALAWTMLRRPAGAVNAPTISPSSRNSANTVPV